MVFYQLCYGVFILFPRNGGDGLVCKGVSITYWCIRSPCRLFVAMLCFIDKNSPCFGKKVCFGAFSSLFNVFILFYFIVCASKIDQRLTTWKD